MKKYSDWDFLGAKSSTIQQLFFTLSSCNSVHFVGFVKCDMPRKSRVTLAISMT